MNKIYIIYGQNIYYIWTKYILYMDKIYIIYGQNIYYTQTKYKLDIDNISIIIQIIDTLYMDKMNII